MFQLMKMQIEWSPPEVGSCVLQAAEFGGWCGLRLTGAQVTSSKVPDASHGTAWCYFVGFQSCSGLLVPVSLFLRFRMGIFVL